MKARPLGLQLGSIRPYRSWQVPPLPSLCVSVQSWKPDFPRAPPRRASGPLISSRWQAGSHTPVAHPPSRPKTTRSTTAAQHPLANTVPGSHMFHLVSALGVLVPPEKDTATRMEHVRRQANMHARDGTEMLARIHRRGMPPTSNTKSKDPVVTPYVRAARDLSTCWMGQGFLGNQLQEARKAMRWRRPSPPHDP